MNTIVYGTFSIETQRKNFEEQVLPVFQKTSTVDLFVAPSMFDLTVTAYKEITAKGFTEYQVTISHYKWSGGLWALLDRRYLLTRTFLEKEANQGYHVTYHDIDPDQEVNRQNLREGVADSDVMFAGKVWEARHLLTNLQLEGIERMSDRIFTKDEALGGIEIYENGGVNVFLKRDNVVVGAFTFRLL